MLLDRTRKITWGAVFTAIGTIMAVISTYTPLAPRVLLLCCGLPVLLGGRVMGLRGALAVYSVTGLIILLLLQPLKGVSYLILVGAVPLLLLRDVKILTAALATFALSLLYLSLSLWLFGVSLNGLQQVLAAWVPGFNLQVIGLSALAVFSIAYPVGLRLIGRQIERHWAFQQLFKP